MFAPDGKTLASASDDGTARLWDVAAGRERALLTLSRSTEDGPSALSTIAFAPDGKTLSVAGDGGQIHLFDVGTGRQRLVFPQKPGYKATRKPPAPELAVQGPPRATVPPDGRLAQEKPNPPTGEALPPRQLSKEEIIQQVVTSTRDSRDRRDNALGTLRQAQIVLRSAEWVEKEYHDRLDRVIQNEIRNTERSLAIRSLAYAPDGRALASAHAGGFIRVWNPADGEEVAQVGRHPQAAHRVDYSPDGRFIASAGDDSAIVLWDPSGKGEWLRVAGRPGVPPCFSFSPDGQAFAFQAFDSVRVIDLETRKNLAVFTDLDWVWGLVFAPDGRTLAGTNPRGLWAWDLTPSPEQTALAGHKTEVQAVAVSPDGTIASGDIEGRILLWSPSGGLAAELIGEPDRRDTDFMRRGVGGLTFSPSGRLVVSKTDQGVITVWDVVTGRARARLNTRSDELITPNRRSAHFPSPARNTLAFSEDGQLFATTSGPGGVSVWDTRTWKELRLEGPHESPLALGFGERASTVMAVYEKRAISRWDLNTHRAHRTPVHRSGFRCGIFSRREDGGDGNCFSRR